jgi:hypothetical protein
LAGVDLIGGLGGQTPRQRGEEVDRVVVLDVGLELPWVLPPTPSYYYSPPPQRASSLPLSASFVTERWLTQVDVLAAEVTSVPLPPAFTTDFLL